jgi:hypothetical protein
MNCDPDEIVSIGGGPKALKTVVKEIMALTGVGRRAIAVFRESGCEPSILQYSDVEKLATDPRFTA